MWQHLFGLAAWPTLVVCIVPVLGLVGGLLPRFVFGDTDAAVEKGDGTPTAATDASPAPVEFGPIEVEPLPVDGTPPDATHWFDGRPIRPASRLYRRGTAYSPDERSCGIFAEPVVIQKCPVK